MSVVKEKEKSKIWLSKKMEIENNINHGIKAWKMSAFMGLVLKRVVEVKVSAKKFDSFTNELSL